ncbi:hypothetical protein V490_04290 [Pseudogymnoascus sp. VKM F-3557]|nr:hypothetical protein V490_04290 [Pseudogymnoascus sp. VKM F-3557]
MLSMIRHLSPTRYIYRTYLVSSGDAFSTLKAIDFERSLSGADTTTAADTGGDVTYTSAAVYCASHVATVPALLPALPGPMASAADATIPSFQRP